MYRLSQIKTEMCCSAIKLLGHEKKILFIMELLKLHFRSTNHELSFLAESADFTKHKSSLFFEDAFIEQWQQTNDF